MGKSLTEKEVGNLILKTSLCDLYNVEHDESIECLSGYLVAPSSLNLERISIKFHRGKIYVSFDRETISLKESKYRYYSECVLGT